jgi:sulfonate transport system substrate-binding protein
MFTPSKKKVVALVAAVTLAVVALPPQASAAPKPLKPRKLSLDFAHWNPLSLVLKKQGLLEKDLKALNTSVEWIYSSGSNKANENLNANAIQIGSHAGAAAFVARANGVPIRTIGVFSQPEWSAIVVGKSSGISNVAQLKGKKIAATKGTDPYYFLLQTLRQFNLDDRKDVEIINLQHADGRTALERGDVDAWAGLDPLMAASVSSGVTKIIYRNPAFNSYGVLSAREDFLKTSPDIVKVVLKNYERARAWIIANPDKAVELLAAEALLDLDVALTVLRDRTNVKISIIPGAAQKQVLTSILPTLVVDAQVRSEADAKKALASLYAPAIAKAVVKENAAATKKKK